MEKEPILYEIGYLLKSDLKDEEISFFLEKARNIVAEKKGLILAEGKVKKQILAYPIKKEQMAFFNWISCMVTPEAIKEIKKQLDKENTILRFLIIQTQRETQKKTPKTKIKKQKIPAGIKNLMAASPEPLSAEEKKEIKIKEEEIDKKIEELLGEN